MERKKEAGRVYVRSAGRTQEYTKMDDGWREGEKRPHEKLEYLESRDGINPMLPAERKSPTPNSQFLDEKTVPKRRRKDG